MLLASISYGYLSVSVYFCARIRNQLLVSLCPARSYKGAYYIIVCLLIRQIEYSFQKYSVECKGPDEGQPPKLVYLKDKLADYYILVLGIGNKER